MGQLYGCSMTPSPQQQWDERTRGILERFQRLTILTTTDTGINSKEQRSDLEQAFASINKAVAEIVIGTKIGISLKDGSEPPESVMEDIRFITDNLRAAQRAIIGGES